MPYPFYLREGDTINTLYIENISKIYESEYYLNDAKTPTPIWKYYITMTNSKQYTQTFETEYQANCSRSDLIGLLREPV